MHLTNPNQGLVMQVQTQHLYPHCSYCVLLEENVPANASGYLLPVLLQTNNSTG